MKFIEFIDKILEGGSIIDRYRNRSSRGKELITPLQSAAIIVIAIAAIFVFWYGMMYEKPVYKTNADELKYTLEAAYEKRHYIDDLDKITNFQWDRLYVFPPYTTKDDIYRTIGYNFGTAKESLSEESNNIVFTYKGKVVCYIYGHPDFFGVYINVNPVPGKYFSVSPEDNPTFSLSKTKSGVYRLDYKYRTDRPRIELQNMPSTNMEKNNRK